MVQEQLAHGAVAVGKDVAPGFQIHNALVQMHRAARLAGHGLGHEGGRHVVLERRLAHGALEHQNLVSQVQRLAVTEVDFHLRGAFFVDQRIQIQPLGLAPVVHVFEQRVELVGGVDGKRLPARLLPARAPDRRLERQVRILAALGQVELHLRRDDGLPALVRVHLQHALEDVARRDLDGIAHLVVGVVDDLRSRLDGPGHQKHRVRVGPAEHVDVGGIEQLVIDIVLDVVTGHGLQQHALRQAHALFIKELVGGRDLAARNAGQIADQALHLGNLAFFQPAGELVELAGHIDLRN